MFSFMWQFPTPCTFSFTKCFHVVFFHILNLTECVCCVMTVREGGAGGEWLCAVQRRGENHTGGTDSGSKGASVRQQQDSGLRVSQRSSTAPAAPSGAQPITITHEVVKDSDGIITLEKNHGIVFTPLK